MKVKIDDNWLRLITWTIMDGCLVRRYNKTNNCENIHHLQFKLSKRRKINYLRGLLIKMKVPFTYRFCKKSGLNKLQPYYIRIYGDSARECYKYLEGKKEFPESFLDLTKKQFKIILSMIAITDGCKSYSKYVWTTTSEKDFRLIATLCSIHSIKHIIYNHKLSSGFINARKQYKMGFYI